MAGVAKLLMAAAVLGSLLAATPASAATGAIDWKPCPDAPGVDCGTVTVPIDWAHPDRGTVEHRARTAQGHGPAGAHRVDL